MAQSIDCLKESPSQTAGPYVHIGLTPNFVDIGGVYETDLGVVMVSDKTKGERIRIKVRVLDGT
ncbi:MAG: protocatechuate 3,4-dioxygenase subunit alpha, partial [Mesorhizobium sp.]